jgi:anti-sigma regulatory factor (Ser/Thr protein kinase)
MLVSQDPKTEIMTETLELTVASVEQAGETLAQKLANAGWEQEAASFARTVVQEYGLNVADHSRQNDAARLVMRVLLRPGCCQLIFEDSGMEWDYREQLHYAEQYEGMAERGRGLLLLNALTAYGDVCRINDKNIGLFVVPRYRNVEGQEGEPA